MNNGGNRCHEGVAHGNDFVARADPRRQQCEMQCVIAAVYPHCEPDAHEIRQVFFEVAQLLAQHQIAFGQSISDGEIYFALQISVVLPWDRQTVHGMTSVASCDIQNEIVATGRQIGGESAAAADKTWSFSI